MLKAFQRIEERLALLSVERVLHVLAHEVDRLSQTTCDWAYWDDTYQYASDHNQDYENSNLKPISFSGVGVDTIVILGTTGEVLFAGRYNRSEESVESIPEIISTGNKAGKPLLPLLENKEGSSGYCIIAGTPTYLVSRPILTSQNKGPSTGTLVMGRFIDGEFLKNLMELVQTQVRLSLIDGSVQLPEETTNILYHLNQDASDTYIRALNTEVLEGYSLINDLFGNPLLLLCVTTTREVFTNARNASWLVVGSAIPAGLLCGLFLLLLLDRTLVSRVSNLSAQALRIGEEKDTSKRVFLPGNDEIGQLAQAVNGMLEGLEKAGEETRKSHELYWTLFEHSPLATLLADPITGEVVDGNPIALLYFGYAEKELRELKISDLLTECPDEMNEVLTGKNPSTLPLTFSAHSRLSSGTIRDVEAHVSIIEMEDRLLTLLAIHDVTERRIAQEEVFRLQRFYHLVLDSIPADLAVFDLDGRALYINPAAIEDESLRRWFIGRTDEEYCERLSLDPSIAKKRRDYREDCISKRCMVLFEEEIETADGQKKCFLRFYSPVIEANEEITKVIGYGFDMTERKMAEEALRNSEERYRLLFEGSHDAIAVYGMDFRAILFNRHFEELIGYSREEYFTIDPLLPVHPDDREKLISNNRKRLAGISVDRSYEFRVVRKDGEIRHVEASFDPVIRGEEIIGVQGLFRDVTEKRRTEAALKEREDRYRLLFDHSYDGIALLGRDLVPLLVNHRLSEMLGYTQEELLTISIDQVVHADDLEKAKKNHLERLKGKPVPRTYEIRLIRRDGEILEVEGSFDSIYRGNEIIGIQAMLRDTTERKRIQERLLERQKEESIITLAGGIAHDFNNILVGIMGSAALLQEDLANQPGSESLVNNILTSAGRMADLTNQLLAYARGGKHRPEPTNINEIINDTLRMLHGSLSPAIHLVCDLDPDLWPIHADRNQITQVLLNILMNACEAMENGGTLLVQSRNVQRSQAWYGARPEPIPAGDFVHIMVSDTGTGMSEETRKRLFDPFFTTKFMGRGLGLAAAMGIIRNHEGALNVESELGSGSTFHIHLPRGSVQIPKNHVGKNSTIPKSGTVLVVDDENAVRNVASRMLKRLGFSVIEANDGQTAIDIYKADPESVNLVLLDMQMPGMGGPEVFSRLHSIDPDVRILISSGYEESTIPDGITSCNRLAGFIKKPYTLKGLEAAIEKALRYQPEGKNDQKTTGMGVDA